MTGPTLHDRITQLPVLCSLYCLAYQIFLRLRTWRAGRGGQAPLLVFQMGKVGSSTVLASLEASGANRLLFHAHFLSDELPSPAALEPSSSTKKCVSQCQQSFDKNDISL